MEDLIEKPLEQNHELLLELGDGTMELKKVEVCMHFKSLKRKLDGAPAYSFLISLAIKSISWIRNFSFDQELLAVSWIHLLV